MTHDGSRWSGGRGLAGVALMAAVVMFAQFVAAPAKAADDFGTWQWTSVECYKEGAFSATLFNELRWRDDSSDFSLGLVGPLFRHQTWSHTSFALGAYYLHVPRGFNLDDTNQAWLDLEMLNTWKATEDWTISVRNMFENRWLEDPHGMRQVSRHRVGAAWSGWKPGPLAKLYANNEVFLDWDSGEFRENRAIPLAAAFKLHESVCLELFPMIRSSKGGGDWTHEFIIGTHLIWKP